MAGVLPLAKISSACQFSDQFTLSCTSGLTKAGPDKWNSVCRAERYGVLARDTEQTAVGVADAGKTRLISLVIDSLSILQRK